MLNDHTLQSHFRSASQRRFFDIHFPALIASANLTIILMPAVNEGRRHHVT